MSPRSILNRALSAAVHVTTSPDSHSRVRRRIAQLTRDAYRATATRTDGFAFSAYGVWLAQRPGDATYDFALTGAYGDGVARWLRKRATPFAFVDVGANIGLYSAVAANNVQSRRIDAFEPDPDTIPFLRQTIEKATAPSQCHVHPVALSDSSGIATLQRVSGHSGASTLRAGFTGANASEVTVEDHRYLDSHVAIQADLPILVKIDVEGSEHAVLTELVEWQAWPQVDEICAELDSNYCNVGDVIDLLAEHGFEVAERWGTDTHGDTIFRRRPPQQSHTRSD